jgi:hypothetical protein
MTSAANLSTGAGRRAASRFFVARYRQRCLRVTFF